MVTISKLAIIIFFLYLIYVWIIIQPSKATFLLLFTIGLSPSFAVLDSQYTARGSLIVNLNDILLSGLFLSILLRNKASLGKTEYSTYPLMQVNKTILILYFSVFLFSSLIRPLDQTIFQFLYLLRYTISLMAGIYVWKYLNVKNIDIYCEVLFINVGINSIYSIMEFINSFYSGRFQLYGNVPRTSGIFGMCIGSTYESDIMDPNTYGLYIVLTLIINILYIFYNNPEGIKKKIAILSMSFSIIALHLTMTRTAIISFWIVLFYLLIVVYMKYPKKVIILLVFSSAIIILFFYTANCIGININELLADRIYEETYTEIKNGELGSGKHRLQIAYDILLYMLSHPTKLFGHGIATQRLYLDDLVKEGIVPFTAGVLHNGYIEIIWNAGILGLIVWFYWFKRHFIVFSKIQNQIKDIEWLALSLKTILIVFLIALFTSEFTRNSRLISYFSFLTGLLLKYVFMNEKTVKI